jgi:hypothetical protein
LTPFNEVWFQCRRHSLRFPKWATLEQPSKKCVSQFKTVPAGGGGGPIDAAVMWTDFHFQHPHLFHSHLDMSNNHSQACSRGAMPCFFIRMLSNPSHKFLGPGAREVPVRLGI